MDNLDVEELDSNLEYILIDNAKATLQKVEKATESLEDQGPLSVIGLAVGRLF